MANVNGTEINLMPTEGMKVGARQYKKWKSEGKKGGTQVAAVRANQILSGKELSPSVVMRMFSFLQDMKWIKKLKDLGLVRKGIRQQGESLGRPKAMTQGFSWSRKKIRTNKESKSKI